MEKPSLDNYLAYAEEIADKLLNRKYFSRPEEVREEMRQEALVRAWKSWSRVDGEQEWKRFCQKQVINAVKDYLRAGHDFRENAWRYRDDVEAHVSRCEVLDRETGAPMQTENFVALEGKHSELELGKMNVDLLSRMCKQDRSLRIFVKHLFGHSFDEIAKNEKKSMTGMRANQIYHKFLEKIKNRNNHSNPWIRQVIYALGLNVHLDTWLAGGKFGWSYQREDLFNLTACEIESGGAEIDQKPSQMAFEV